jgi:hypothetical protein
MNLTRRTFLKSASLGPACLGAANLPLVFGAQSERKETPVKDWLKRRGRIYWYDQYALNEQDAAFAKYDPDRITEELAGTGADIIVVYAANQFSIAYYPSKVWPQHPNLRGRDYVGDLITRLRARGKKVVTYINWLESRHPEWNTIPLGNENNPDHKEMPLVSWADPNDPDKRVQRVPGGRWRFPCINSPRRQQVLAVAREIVQRYRPDGFHLDMFHANGALCVCQYCRPEVERICGTKEITHQAVAAHWREYIDWKCQRSASLIAELTAMLHERGILACHNAAFPLHLPSIYGVGEEWMPYLDVYVSEIFSNLYMPSTTVRLQRALGLPSWELLTSTAPNYAHLSVPAAWWRMSAATCKANGGEVLGPCGVGAYPDTTSSRLLLDTVKSGFDFFMQDADLAEGAVSIAKVGLVFSWATRKYFKEGAMNWSEEIDGWSRLLIGEHLPFDLIVAEKVASAADLPRHDLVILPNTANMSEALCGAVTEYVRSGGRVLAVGETSLFDEKGHKRTDFALKELLGVSSKGSFEGNFAIERPGGPEPATGILQHVVTSAKVVARHVSVDPAGSVSGTRDPLPIKPTEWPVVVVNTFGKGQAVYVGFDVGRMYANQSLPHIASFMADVVNSTLPDRQIVVKAPRSIEVTVFQQQARQRIIIHLADMTQSPADMTRITEIIPVHDIEVTIPAPFADPKVSCRGSEVSSSVDGDRFHIRVFRIDSYAAVVIEPNAK